MDLIENPFFILKASPQDDRKKLIELADEATLKGDPDLVNRARLILNNPRKRLAAEISWLPTVEAQLIDELIQLVTTRKDLINIRNKWDLPQLAFANFVSTLISKKNKYDDGLYLTKLLVVAYEQFDINEIQESINYDRYNDINCPITIFTAFGNFCHFSFIIPSCSDLQTIY